MIIDKISNINKYSALIPNVDSFFKYMETNDLKQGVNVINEKVDLIVIESETVALRSHLFENHQKCIDIHFVVSGSENISIGKIDKAKIFTSYNEDTDCELFKDLFVTHEIRMKSNHFIAIFPDEPHETTISVNGIPEYLKKVVVKVKL
ncbi:MAG: YhcH/YjgK/YiaL family protein [Bacteroidetes bacterium]|nr:YhcH/YjgK/YiaL family protein [Bacteroidota bacterium]MBT7579454.1 YhcH/YjgK/YiaL family protein [Candidatus Neomarinimicrobiota bacterium]